jgi:hypothetical protein
MKVANSMQICGIDISHEWCQTGFVKREKECIRLHVLRERKLEDPQRLEGYDRCPLLDDPHRGNEQTGRDEKSVVSAGYGKLAEMQKFEKIEMSSRRWVSYQSNYQTKIFASIRLFLILLQVWMEFF